MSEQAAEIKASVVTRLIRAAQSAKPGIATFAANDNWPVGNNMVAA